MSVKTISLGPHEKVVAVTPELAAGPGWSNAITWVHIVDYANGKYRCEDIQPSERTPLLHHIWGIAASANAALMDSVPTKKQQKGKAK